MTLKFKHEILLQECPKNSDNFFSVFYLTLPLFYFPFLFCLHSKFTHGVIFEVLMDKAVSFMKKKKLDKRKEHEYNFSLIRR